MLKARNLCFTIGSACIANRNFNYFEIKLCRPEDQVEIAERVELAKVPPVGCDALISFTGKHFRATQGICETLIE